MQDLSGKTIGRYHILDQIGKGGMAVVYKAFDTSLEREVAIKIIRKDAFPVDAHKRILKRFEQEAKTLAKLSHANIIKVFDYGEYEGAPFLVMELFTGGTLKSYMEKPLPPSQAINLLLPVARGLAYAHKHGILHRDIKPSNIPINDQTGEVILTDFGIAKLLENQDGITLTNTGVGVGTPEYMAPEQGFGKDIDGRADVYALGIVLYELLTGNKPFQAETPLAVLYKHMNDPLPRPKNIVPKLPSTYEQVLIKALAKKPENRYADMEAFIKALEKSSNVKTETNILESTHSKSIDGSKTSKPTIDEILTADDQKEKGKPLKSRWYVIIPGVIIISLLIYLTITNFDNLPFSAAQILSPTSTNTHTIEPSKTCSMTNTVIITQTNTPQKTATITNSPTQEILQTNTPSEIIENPIAIPETDMLVNFSYHQNFDSSGKLVYWYLGNNSKVQNGVLDCIGKGYWIGSGRILTIQDREGVLVSLKFSEKSDVEIYLDSGSWQSKGYRRWGVYFYSGHYNWIQTGIYTDYSERLDGDFQGNLILIPDTWYNLLLIIGGENEFIARIWDNQNPGYSLEYKEIMGEDWSNLDWTFRVNAYAGEIQIDNYLEVSLSENPN